MVLIVSSAVAFLTGFITAKQRRFNTSILQALNEIADLLDKDVKGRTTAKHTQESEAVIDELQKQVEALTARLALQEKRSADLLDQLKGQMLSSLDNGCIRCTDENMHQYDGLYLDFEDRFRGSRELIKERVREYLPLLKDAGVVGSDRCVVDLGCGRGEWLELLKEQGIHAQGIDLNRVMVEMCCERGLHVMECDAVSFLRNLPDASVGVVTGFHIVEHLSFELLIEMLDEALRVLTPGGFALFETPNPQNLIVGSWYFYLDPTHRNPLPSPTLKFLAEARGFSRVEIINLHLSDIPRLNEVSEVAKRFNEYYCGPMDYALVAWRD